MRQPNKLNIKSLIFLLVILALFIPGHSQEMNLVQLLKDSTKADQYPESPVYHFYLYRQIERDNQGIIKENVDHFFQLLNQKGRDAHSNYRMTFNKESQTIQVNTSDSVLKEDKIAGVEKDGINDVTPPALSNAGMYANIVDRVYSFQQVQPGDGIHVRYTKQDLKQTGMPFSGCILLHTEEPGENLVYSISAPKKPVYRISGKSDNIEVAETDNRITVTVKSSPFLTPEPYTPSLEQRSPKLFFSETNEWSQILTPLQQDLETKATPTKAIQMCVKKVCQQAKTNTDKINAIYNFMTKEIKKVRIPVWLSGYTAHSADVVLNNRYCDPKDGAVLLLSLLKSAKFNAFPVLSSSTGTINEDIPNLDQYDGILIAVEVEKGKTLILDPFTEYKTIDFLHLIDSRTGKALKPGFPNLELPKCDSTIETTVRLNLTDEHNAQFHIHVSANGYCDMIMRQQLYYKSKEEQLKYFQTAAQKLVEGATLKNFTVTHLDDFTKNVEIDLDITSDNPTISQKHITFLTIPAFEIATYPYDLFLDQRKNDLSLPYPVKCVTRWEIAMEKTNHILYFPKSLTGKSQDFTTRLTFQFNEGSGTAIFEKEIKNLKNRYTPEEYAVLKSDLSNLDHWKNNTILWEKAKK
ncbi:MAG: DUF3857 domain-containing protein [Candidatus Omnitrophota bacterium]